MPTVTAGGRTLRYETAGDPERPAVVFLPEAAFGPWQWGWQVPALTGPWQTVVLAFRGTDDSDAGGPYGVDRFAADLETVLVHADVDRVHVVGAGLGGMVALRYARRYTRARSLVLFGAAARGEVLDREALAALHPDDPGRFRESLSLAFSERFLEEAPVVDDVVAWRRAEDATGEALAGHLAAARAFDAGPLYETTLPVLVCHGVDDPVVDLDAGRELAAALPRARFEAVEGRRCCYAEHSVAVTDALEKFFDEVDGAGGT